MENAKPITHKWRVFSIATLSLCILNLAFACIPGIGAYSMFLGILAVILSAVVLVKVIRNRESKLLAIASLLFALASIGIGYWTLNQIDFFDLTKEKPDTLIIKH